MTQTTTQTPPIDEGAIRKAISELTAKKANISKQAAELAALIEDRQMQIGRLIYEGKDSAKLSNDQAADLARLGAMRSALEFAASDLEQAKRSIRDGYRAEYQNAQRELKRDLVRFIDRDLAALVKRFRELSAPQAALLDLAGRALIDRQSGDFPTWEGAVYDVLSFYIGDLQREVDKLERRNPAYFQEARKLK